MIGLKCVGEICARQRLGMDSTLLKDLTPYKCFKDKVRNVFFERVIFFVKNCILMVVVFVTGSDLWLHGD
jgi:hypothetical protein